jgi:predicted aminopeptidase
MLRWDDDELAGTIFHELAHQLIYVKGDTAFNESFASFVQEQGLRAWRTTRSLPPQAGHPQAMADSFSRLVLDLRERLKVLYASGVDETTMAAGKRREIAAFRARYQRWRRQHDSGDQPYDAWVAQPINNAKLLPFGLYDQWTPAFAALFRQAEGSWPAFYAEVRELADEPKARRDRKLQELLSASSQK